MIATNYISTRLMNKLESVGAFDESIFTFEKMHEADRLFLDISTDGSSISYITEDRMERFGAVWYEAGEMWINTKDVWDEELRRKFAIKTKPGRVIQKIAGCELSYGIQRRLRAMLFDSSMYEVQIVKGSNIGKYYAEHNYDEYRGDLGSSCMRTVPSSFFMIYKDHCEMAVVINKNTGKITARSLIFNDCFSANKNETYSNITLMSRIYSVDDVFYDMLKDWGLRKGYGIFDGGHSASSILLPDNDLILIDEYMPCFAIEGNPMHEYSSLPYIDNMPYAVCDDDGNWVLTTDSDFIENIYEYEHIQSTDWTNGYVCDSCTMLCVECPKDRGYSDYSDDYEPEMYSSEWCEMNGCDGCDYYDYEDGYCNR